MSRVVNIDAATDVVQTLCAKHAIAISTIEPLESGGARVVLANMAGADDLRSRMKTKVLNGPVIRSGLYLAQPPRAPHR